MQMSSPFNILDQNLLVSPAMVNTIFWLYQILILVRTLFNYLGMNSIASLISYGALGLILYAFVFYPRRNLRALFVTAVIVLLLSTNTFLFPRTKTFQSVSMYTIQYNCIPNLILCAQITDFADLKKKISFYNSIYLGIALLIMAMYILGVLRLNEQAYMQVAFTSVMPIAFYSYYTIRHPSLLNNIVLGGSIFMLFLIGSRSAPLIVVLILFILLITEWKWSKKERLILFVFCAAMLLSINLILDMLIYLADSFGFSSRTLMTLQEGAFFSSKSRDSTRTILIDYLSERHFPPNGLFGDRYVNQLLTGSDGYAHNFFLESLVDFGLFGCCVLVLLLACWIYYQWRNSGDDRKTLLVLFASLALSRLMVSSSFLIDIPFYSMLGMLITREAPQPKQAKTAANPNAPPRPSQTSTS